MRSGTRGTLSQRGRGSSSLMDALRGACAVLGWMALIAVLLLTALDWVGTNGELYYQLQMRWNVQPFSGISDDSLRVLDMAMARYLSGDRAALQAQGEDETLCGVIVSVFGETRPAFHPWEMRHMADCFDLFELLRFVRKLLLLACPVLLFVGLFARKRFAGAVWVAIALILIPLGLFGLWAWVDFDSAFTFFHQVLFTNDLWLLNPETDLLIRICPEGMFMDMGLRILAWGIVALVRILVLNTLMGLVLNRKEKK